VLVTGVVQSSSAVTVATIGFVNAGLLSLRQALGVVFGTNVGTTMTGWFVSLVGFGLKIEPFALPLLTVGVVVRMARGGRLRGLGEALAGFGLIFLGLAMLQDAFSAWADAQGEALAALRSAGPWAAIGAGFFTTVVTQSSSAAIAILLTAATAGMLDLEGAAAAVIGANVGTTSAERAPRRRRRSGSRSGTSCSTSARASSRCSFCRSCSRASTRRAVGSRSKAARRRGWRRSTRSSTCWVCC
jgi:phosphate:Na+ symporter